MESKSEWTLDTLRGYFESILKERDEKYSQRFISQEERTTLLFAGQEKLTGQSFSSSEAAIMKAEQAQKELNAKSNEFRGQLSDQAKMFMPRAEAERGDENLTKRMDDQYKNFTDKLEFFVKNYDDKREILLKNVTDKIDSQTDLINSLNNRITTMEGRGYGLSQGWSILIGAVVLIGGIIGILAYAKH